LKPCPPIVFLHFLHSAATTLFRRQNVSFWFMVLNFPTFGYNYIEYIILLLWAFPVAQTVKNLPAMQETQVRSLERSSGEGNDNPL